MGAADAQLRKNSPRGKQSLSDSLLDIAQLLAYIQVIYTSRVDVNGALMGRKQAAF
jgi:hypothetical protein